jgi:hypothetical protein
MNVDEIHAFTMRQDEEDENENETSTDPPSERNVGNNTGRHADEILQCSNDKELYRLTAMTRAELEEIMLILCPHIVRPHHRGPEDIFDARDIVFIILVWLSRGWETKMLGLTFQCSSSTISRMINQFLPIVSNRI